MSYLLELPVHPLPHNVHSPPYVIFGIRGKIIESELPSLIPLNALLHFAPKFKQWVLPPPSTTQLPWPVAQIALRTPYIGIDILSHDIEALGLEWIVSRMLQASGLARRKDLFLIHPTILASISIHKTWLALELPVAGIRSLHTHIQTRIMLGPAVTLREMIAIWETFPHTSDVVHAMGLNFISSHINLGYTRSEFSAIRHWHYKSRERCQFFKSLEDQFPKFGEVQDMVLKAALDKVARDSAEKVAFGTWMKGKVARSKKLLEKTGTRKVSPEERKERQLQDGDTMRTRLRKTKSDESIRSVETVIWDPHIEPGSS